MGKKKLIKLNHFKRNVTSAAADPKPFSSVPGPKRLPFIGTMYLSLTEKDFMEKNPYVYARWAKEKYGPIFRTQALGFDFVVITDPQDAETILKNDNEFPDNPVTAPIIAPYRQKLRKDLFKSGGGIMGTVGKEWWDIRRKVQPELLKPANAYFFLPEIQKICKLLVDRVEERLDDKNEMPDNIYHLLQLWAQESRSGQFLDKRLGLLEPGAGYREDVELFLKSQSDLHQTYAILLLTKGLWSRGINTRAFKKFDAAHENLCTFANKNLQETEKSMSEMLRREEAPTRDEMKKLRLTQRICARTGDINSVVSLAVDVSGAGINSVATQAGFLLYHLACNPDAQEKVRKEILEQCGKGKFDHKQLNSLTFLGGCIRESARLLPTNQAIQRKLDKDVVLSGYHIPAGTVFVINHQVMGQLHYPKADQFIPERWIQGEDLYRAHHPFCWLLFGHGRRSCLGRRIAVMELQCIAIEFLRRYRLEWDSGRYGAMETQTNLVNHMDRPLKIKLISL